MFTSAGTQAKYNPEDNPAYAYKPENSAPFKCTRMIH
jgi:hypothetical protein